MASVRRHWKLTPCQAEPVSVSSKTDRPPLAKSLPVSNAGDNIFKKESKKLQRGVRTCKRTSSAHTKLRRRRETRS